MVSKALQVGLHDWLQAVGGLSSKIGDNASLSRCRIC